MRLGIMQPYFFPYIGYFALIRHSDAWVVFDIVKYQPKSWMNRNRILEPNSGAQYISVPVDRKSGRLLNEVRVQDAVSARDKILRQLALYDGAAPHYGAVVDLVERCFSRFGSDGLLRDLNVISLAEVCEYLGLPFRSQRASDLDLDQSQITHAGQWALEISARLGANSYVNPPGGVDIFRPEEWQARKIELCFTPHATVQYEVARRFRFQPNLSIVDCMMWLPPDAVRREIEAMAPVPVT